MRIFGFFFLIDLRMKPSGISWYIRNLDMFFLILTWFAISRFKFFDDWDIVFDISFKVWMFLVEGLNELFEDIDRLWVILFDKPFTSHPWNDIPQHLNFYKSPWNLNNLGVVAPLIYKLCTIHRRHHESFWRHHTRHRRFRFQRILVEEVWKSA